LVITAFRRGRVLASSHCAAFGLLPITASWGAHFLGELRVGGMSPPIFSCPRLSRFGLSETSADQLLGGSGTMTLLRWSRVATQILLAGVRPLR